MDELRKNNVDMDMAILLHQINYVLVAMGSCTARWLSAWVPSVFSEMKVNSFGRAMAYLTLVYLMNIPEDVKREAVCLVAPVLGNVDVARVEESFFLKNVFLDQMCACIVNNAN